MTSWHNNDYDKPAITPDINDLTLRTSSGFLGVTQLVEKVLTIRPAVTLTRVRFLNIPLVVDMSRRSSRIPGLRFFWTPPEFLVATNYFVRRRNLGNATTPRPATKWKIKCHNKRIPCDQLNLPEFNHLFCDRVWPWLVMKNVRVLTMPVCGDWMWHRGSGWGWAIIVTLCVMIFCQQIQSIAQTT